MKALHLTSLTNHFSTEHAGNTMKLLNTIDMIISITSLNFITLATLRVACFASVSYVIFWKRSPVKAPCNKVIIAKQMVWKPGNPLDKPLVICSSHTISALLGSASALFKSAWSCALGERRDSSFSCARFILTCINRLMQRAHSRLCLRLLFYEINHSKASE